MPCRGRLVKNWALSVFSPEYLSSYVFESSRERELVNAYKTMVSEPPRPSEELDGGRFWDIDEIVSSIGKEIFTPNFEGEFKRLFCNEG